MTRLSTIVAAAAVVGLVAPLAPASAQTAAGVPQATVARAGHGSIHGLVFDTQGKPLVGAMVSALGSSVAFALSGRDGRFLLESLPAGAYTLRVHLDGYAPSQRQMVDVRANASPSVVSVALRALSVAGAQTGGPTMLAASLVPLDGLAGGADADEDHSHTDTAWRLRHLKRSVLKDTDSPFIITDEAVAPAPDGTGTFFGRAFENSARMAASIFGDLSLSGQVNFVTTGTFTGPSDFLSPNAFAAASVAYVSLGAPMGRLGDWSVSGAMTQGNLGSWFVAGALTARPVSSHRYVAGLSYSTQRVSTFDPFAVVAINGGSRAMGRVYGLDEWLISRRVSLGYGLSYAWQDYASGDGLLSPRVSLTVSPVNRLRVHTLMARNTLAPGADEFIPVTKGLASMWLPSQRTFSAWGNPADLRSQTTDHFEIGVERDVDAYVVGFRTFYQRIDDQAGAVFAAPSLEHPAATPGHYYVGNLGDVAARGWAVTVSRPIIGSVRGSVDYSQTSTRWQNGVASAMTSQFADDRRADGERIHDLTTSVETAISQTATRVYVLYKLNSAYARPLSDPHGPGFDARFDIQVNQALPFLNFTSADWEVLVAVCNLFRETAGERSVYDELLVVRPPKRVVGGVRVRF
jgi:hypothetical protein